jgi:hypothetical protein
MGFPKANIIGQVFDRLTVVSFSHSDGNYQAYWKCDCVCGRQATARISMLRNGHVRSCGCLSRASHSGSVVELSAWKRMIRRCRDPRDAVYSHYGGRGISVCERWNEYESFYADMGARPGTGYSLDRIDVNGNYEPSNCRWADTKTQARNKRNSLFTEETAMQVRWLCRDGGFQTRQVADAFGVPIWAVRRVAAGETWS